MAKRVFDSEGIEEVRNQLAALSVGNPKFHAKVESIMHKALAIIKKDIQDNAKSVMRDDPRQAYKAVVYTVYRRVLGGNVNILNRRSRLAPTSYQRPRTLRPGQRGGNRRKQSEKTKRMESYQSFDRSFILYFMNTGTSQRKTKHGNRGRARGKRFFSQGARAGSAKATAFITQTVDRLWKEEFSS